MLKEKIVFPEFISEKTKKEILNAIKKKKVIIISGSQKPTGKTTITNILRANGITVFEKWECEEITL